MTRVQIFDINGTYISQFGETGAADGQFNEPQRITTNGTHLFVVDTSNNRVQIFDITVIMQASLEVQVLLMANFLVLMELPQTVLIFS